ncbi:OmpW family protein [Solimonas sp. SE-A11]|uniref:OmpW/AlkL family protein n=1 Tax=Solimonas sp. SE-A11 TaxID=3054954 RepID=UPI00259CFB32|nr:OmpW family outer membrane protein [Solimonas sp. SE-A11]MDM4770406.1 OmpW family outer membrane protein [Solimonas sp. SE-A11]
MKTIPCLPALVCAAFACAATAREAGDHQLQLGVVHVNTLDSSEPLRTKLRPSLLGGALGIESDFVSAGTAATVGSSETLLFIYSYYFTDHWSLKLEGGVPARFDIAGEGVVRPTGIAGSLISVDLGAPANNPLANATQWSPVAMLQYSFGSPRDPVRPYVGVGLTYTWFTDVELSSSFDTALNNQFGRVLALAAGKPGATYTKADASPSFAPAFNVGLAMSLSEHWNVSASVSYLMLSTESTIDIYAADGTRLSRSSTDLDLNPLAVSVLVGYRFKL